MSRMEKLTLKELAPYLPYGLKFLHIPDNEFFTLNALYDNGDAFSWDLGETSTDMIKPSLRPLSDLTKEIEHNGERFVPMSSLETQDFYIDEEYVIEDTKSLPYFIFQQLIEWHFDVFGLIAKGLAIDINTLEK